MITALGLLLLAVGGLLLWGAVTNRSALGEVKAALGVDQKG